MADNLVERARLDDAEIRKALGQWPPSRKTSQPDYCVVADAATAKALWAVVDWLRGKADTQPPDAPYEVAIWRKRWVQVGYHCAAEDLRDMVTAADKERPDDH